MNNKEKETKSSGRVDIRFEREAKALQVNLEKRKQQQKKRAALKKQASASVTGTEDFETNQQTAVIAAENA